MFSQKKRILVVDDEKDILELLHVILEKEEFEVWEANTSREALKQIEKMPDLVLLDVRMPGKLSGIDVCHRLKKDEKYLPSLQYNLIQDQKKNLENYELFTKTKNVFFRLRVYPCFSKDIIYLSFLT